MDNKESHSSKFNKLMIRSLLKILNLNFIFFANSYFWKQLLRLNGIQVGKNFYVEGYVFIKLRGLKKDSSVIIDNNVKIFGNIDIRTRESGCIYIENNVSFDDDVRLVAARSGKIRIKEGCEIGKGTIINAGENVLINENTLIGPYCLIQASNHGYRGKGPIKGQEYTHAPISIGRGSWLAANVIVLPGIVIEDGAVIGASAVVTKNIETNSINAGNPSKRISYRVI